MRNCQKCGKQLDEDAIFCEACGTKQGSPTPSKMFVERPRQPKPNNSASSPINNQQNTNQSKPQNNKNNEMYYQTTWFTILMLIIFTPIGLFTMWSYKKFTQFERIVTSCVAAVYMFFCFLIFVGILGIIVSDPSTEVTYNTEVTTELTTEATTETTTVITETTTELIELDYTIVDSSDYVRDGQICKAYRIVVDKNATESQLKNIYHKVSDSDGSYLHTIWFYSDAAIAGNDLYDVAMLEELTKGEEPNIEIRTEKTPQTTAAPTTETTTLEITTVEVTTASPQVDANVDYNSNMVYIGDTGNKYHNASCSTLKGNGHAISLETALSQGRTACKRCKP